MPARPSRKFCCYCIICSETGPDGTPVGKMILESQRTAHLARAKAEIEARRQSDIQKAAASLFASTLVDDGPNPHAQSSRLLSSHEGHQSFAPTTSPESETLSLNTIIESFQRLQFEVQDSTLVQSITQSFFPSESEALPFNTVYPEIQDSTPVQPALLSGFSSLPSVDMEEASTLNCSAKRLQKRVQKRERSKLTIIAHCTLDHVENQMHHCSLRLANITLADTMADIEHDIGRIQTAFSSVKRDVQSVNARKVAIGDSLTQLQTRLVDLRRLYPIIDDKPLQFDSGKYPFFQA